LKLKRGTGGGENDNSYPMEAKLRGDCRNYSDS